MRWLLANALSLLVLTQCGDASDSTSATSSSSSGATTSSGGGGSPNTWQARCDDGWCYVPAGSFTMGSPPDEWGRGQSEDQVDVTLTRPFIIQQNELTRAEWTSAGLPIPPPIPDASLPLCEEDACPIGNLTWFDAVAYANELSKLENRQQCYGLADCTGAPGAALKCGQLTAPHDPVYGCTGYRLPTEAEWEYAARAGTTTAFYSGVITTQEEQGTCFHEPNLDDIAWYCHNSDIKTHPVGLKAPNSIGIYDMLGNIPEWVHNDYHSVGYDWQQTGLPLVDPLGELRPEEIDDRVFRGGTANLWASLSRCAAHISGFSWAAGPGVRLVRTLDSDAKWPR